MSGKHIRSPVDYASAGNYFAPGQEWDGQPSRFPITASMLLAGAAPDAPIGADIENAREAILFDAAAVQIHAALQTWRLTSPPVSGTLGNTQLIFGPVPGLQQKIAFVLEVNDSSADNTFVARSNDGSIWKPKGGASPAFTNFTACAPGPAGTILIIQLSPAVQWSTDYGTTWTENSVGFTNSLAVHYGLNRFWLCQHGEVIVATSAAGLISGTHATMPVPGGGSFTGSPEFADDKIGTICLISNATGGSAPTYPSVYTSTDLGTTWTKTLDLTGSLHGNLHYDSVRGLFVTWDDTGSVSTSADGLTWVRGTATTGSASAGMVTGAHTFAIVGAAIAKLWLVNTGSDFAQGVAYSFDLGASWYIYIFGSDTVQLTQLRAGNNRLHALDPFRIWQSAPIATNDKDL